MQRRAKERERIHGSHVRPLDEPLSNGILSFNCRHSRNFVHRTIPPRDALEKKIDALTSMVEQGFTAAKDDIAEHELKGDSDLGGTLSDKR